MIMICDKYATCEIECIDKYPHEEEIACKVRCDWNGKCILYKIDMSGIKDDR